MAYNIDQWKTRIASRIDICAQVTHLTKRSPSQNAFDVLIEILTTHILNGSTTTSGFITGNRPAVCFMESPLYSICQNIDFEQKIFTGMAGSGRRRYEPFGLMFPKEYIYQNGGRPVIYDNTNDAKLYLNQNEWWRIVKFDLTDTNNIVDWTHEREWRIPDNFDFDVKLATVILPNSNMFKAFYTKHSNLANKVKSAINLGPLWF
jgi:hypothetical protein